MKRWTLIAFASLVCVASLWLFLGRTADTDTAAMSAPAKHKSAVMAPDVQADEPHSKRAFQIPRKPPIPPMPPIPANRVRRDVPLSSEELSKHDPAAFVLVMAGLKGIRPAIRKCVLDLEASVKEPTVLEWPMVLDLETDDTGTVRVVDASVDEWPEAIPAEMRECFSVAFAGVEFDADDERFAYKITYPMAVGLAPPAQ